MLGKQGVHALVSDVQTVQLVERQLVPRAHPAEFRLDKTVETRELGREDLEMTQ